MKCLLWFKEKENKEPKMYLMMKGTKDKMCSFMEAFIGALRS